MPPFYLSFGLLAAALLVVWWVVLHKERIKIAIPMLMDQARREEEQAEPAQQVDARERLHDLLDHYLDVQEKEGRHLDAHIDHERYIISCHPAETQAFLDKFNETHQQEAP